MKIPGKHIDLVLISTGASVCTIVLVAISRISSGTNENEWLRLNQATAISCGKDLPTEPGSSGDRNNGSGCAHQFGGSCLLGISADRRNKIQTC